MAWLSVLLACGCAGVPVTPVTTVADRLPVLGKVYLDGRPLPLGTVSFMPESEQGATATGKIESDGSFAMGTWTPRDGVLAGKYRVAIIAWGTPPTRPDGVGQRLIPERYFDSHKSGIPQVEVPLPSDQELKIELRSK
jgi:hypothetical protein